MRQDQCYVFWLTDKRFGGFIEDILRDLPPIEGEFRNGETIESFRRRLECWQATQTYHGAAIALMAAAEVKGNVYASTRAAELYDILSDVSAEQGLMDRVTGGEIISVATEQMDLAECYSLSPPYHAAAV